MKLSDIKNIDHVRLLNDISAMILNNSELSVTTSDILKMIDQRFPTLFYIYFLKDEDNNLCIQSFTDHLFPLVKRIVNFDVKKILYPLSCNDPLICKCFNEKRLVKSKYLRDFFHPIFKSPKILDIIQKMLGIKNCVGLPISLKSEVIGVLFFTNTEELNSKEIEILQLYANLSAIAIDNSIHIQNLEEKYLQEKTTTSILSHELKTPIAIAHGNIQMLKIFLSNIAEKFNFSSIEANKKHKNIFKELQTMHAEIEGSIKRLNYICNSIFNLMDSDNRDNTVTHKFKLNEQIAQVMTNYSKKASEKGLDFKAAVEKHNKTLIGGGLQFEQIMTILLDNAVKYTKNGSINVKISHANGEIIASVSDTGPGIPKKYKQKIFERFYRHRSLRNKNLHNIEGLGLGLYIAKTLAERIGGSIAVENNPEGKGSKFTVKIPVS